MYSLLFSLFSENNITHNTGYKWLPEFWSQGGNRLLLVNKFDFDLQPPVTGYQLAPSQSITGYQRLRKNQKFSGNRLTALAESAMPTPGIGTSIKVLLKYLVWKALRLSIAEDPLQSQNRFSSHGLYV